MRYFLISADEPTVKKRIDIPDRLVKGKRNPKKVKRIKSRKNSSSATMDAINKQQQTSKSIISHKRHNGRAVHRRV